MSQWVEKDKENNYPSGNILPATVTKEEDELEEEQKEEEGEEVEKPGYKR